MRLAFLLFLIFASTPHLASQQSRPATSKKPKSATSEQVVDARIPWLEQDVKWIITPEEARAFKQLTNDEEREQFIEAFWTRRDPTPDTIRNEFKQEHYTRMAYANEHFAPHDTSGRRGWETDRGRIYVVYGPPDHVEPHPKQIGDSTYSAETWHYRYVQDFEREADLEFIDECRCNKFEFTVGAVDYQKVRDTITPPRGGPKTPQVRFKDLEEVVFVKIRFSQFQIAVHADSRKLTDASTFVPLTVAMKNKEITLGPEQGIPPTRSGRLEIFGVIRNMSGRIEGIFEDILGVHEVKLEKKISPEEESISRNTFALRPGHYRLDIAVKDVNGDRLSTFRQGIIVPDYNNAR
ncbi:MAG: hypothetical protein JWO13_3191 [Acidobacteriales bacterium]|nr:hypothetical protein [Terriglobales bacterium]